MIMTSSLYMSMIIFIGWLQGWKIRQIYFLIIFEVLLNFFRKFLFQIYLLPSFWELFAFQTKGIIFDFGAFRRNVSVGIETAHMRSGPPTLASSE